MKDITKEAVTKLERVRVINYRIAIIRMVYTLGMVFATWYSSKNGLYEKYGYTVLSMTLTANLLWTIGDLYNSSIKTIIDIFPNERK